MKAFRILITGLLVALLASCGGGGNDSPMGQANQFCFAIAQPGGNASCEGCTQVSDTGNAFDGRLDSGASMGGGGQGNFSGTAATQPAGRVAGVYFVLPPAPNGITVSISTYLNNVLQDSGGPSTQGSNSQTCNTSMDCLGSGTEGFIGLHTTKSYNKIEAAIGNTNTARLQVRELCVR